MTTGDPANPDDDGTVGAAMFLLELGGTWVTDCGCMTVIDESRWSLVGFGPRYPPNSTRYVVAYAYQNETGPVSDGQSVTWTPSGPLEAVVHALDHDCGEQGYMPVAVVPV